MNNVPLHLCPLTQCSSKLKHWFLSWHSFISVDVRWVLNWSGTIIGEASNSCCVGDASNKWLRWISNDLLWGDVQIFYVSCGWYVRLATNGGKWSSVSSQIETRENALLMSTNCAFLSSLWIFNFLHVTKRWRIGKELEIGGTKSCLGP